MCVAKCMCLLAMYTYITRIYIIYVRIFSLPMCWHTCAGNKGFVSYASLSMIQGGYTHTYIRRHASLWCSSCCDVMTPYKLLTNADFKLNWPIHWGDHSSMQENGIKNVLLALQA